ncbi:hypothetical protein C8R44DRAFT_611113, partial [Mycena epipterygia]
MSLALSKKKKAIQDKCAAKKVTSVDEPPIFPPVLPDKLLRHEIITGMCEDVNPQHIEESGCAVCGQLT